MNMTQHRISSAIVFLLSLIVCYVSFTAQPSEAYSFPRLISMFFVAFATWTFVKAVRGQSKAGVGLSKEIFKNIAPGVIISAIYIFWAAKNMGFYVATTITFFTLLSLYDPAPHNLPKTWIKRVLVTAGFIIIMYALFAQVLKVYTPRGMFI